jgi:hypothetical protein
MRFSPEKCIFIYWNHDCGRDASYLQRKQVLKSSFQDRNLYNLSISANTTEKMEKDYQNESWE